MFRHEDTFFITEPDSKLTIEYEFIESKSGLFTDIVLRPDQSIDAMKLNKVQFQLNRFPEKKIPKSPEERILSSYHGENSLKLIYPPYFKSDTMKFDSANTFTSIIPSAAEEATKEEIQQSKELGETLSTTTDVFGNVGSSLGLIGVLSGADPPGTLMKTAQIIKFFNRIKYIYCDFGILVNSFFENLKPGFSISKDDIRLTHLVLSRSRGKITPDEIPLFLFGTKIYPQFYLYLMVSVIKLCISPWKKSLRGILYSRPDEEVPQGFVFRCKTIYWVDKASFTIFFISFADILFVSPQVIQNLTYFDSEQGIYFWVKFICNLALLLFTCLDLLNIFMVSISIKNDDYFTDELSKYKTDSITSIA